MMVHAARNQKAVSQSEWLAARKELLVKEKQLTRQYDELARQRRELPWARIEKDYVFEGPRGNETLAELFEDRSQLIVSHFMFGPAWSEGCVGCSFRSDHVDACLPHLEHHDVSFVTISRAPFAQIEAFRKRMGWRFKWLSSQTNDFNFDFHVSCTPEEIAAGKTYYNYEESDLVSEEMSGVSVFSRDESGGIFHTYSAFGRGDELVDTTYMYLDLTPKGRNETGPRGNLMDWVRHHDRYSAGPADPSCGCAPR